MKGGGGWTAPKRKGGSKPSLLRINNTLFDFRDEFVAAQIAGAGDLVVRDHTQDFAVVSGNEN